MGNSSSYNLKSSKSSGSIKDSSSSPRPGELRIDSNMRRFSQFLNIQHDEDSTAEGITPSIMTKYLCNGNESLANCMFLQFARLSGAVSPNIGPSDPLPSSLTAEQFFIASNHFIGLITDAEQLGFFIKGFTRTDQIERAQVNEMVLAAYQMAHLHSPVLCPNLAKAVVDAAMHSKNSINVNYFNKWCGQHCHRLVYWMHRHIATTLSTTVRDPSPLAAPPDNILLAPANDTTAKVNKEEKYESTPSPPSTSSTKSAAPRKRKTSIQHSSLKVLYEDGLKDTKRAIQRKISAPSGPHPVCAIPDAGQLIKSQSVYGLTDRSQSVHELADKKAAMLFSLELNQTPDYRDEADADTPVLESDSSLKSSLNPSLMWLLTCSLPLRYTKQPALNDLRDARRPSLPVMGAIHSMLHSCRPKHWEPLYVSDRDGLSMNRFQHHVFNYRGPTLAIITAQDDDMAFCLALDSEWQDSKNFWGGDDCRLLQIRPQYRVLEGKEKMMYFNQTWRGFPTGIQVGGDYQSRALTVNSELSQLQYHNMPYKLASIEVWGCGAQQIREQQQEFKKREVRDVESRRKVKISSTDWLEHPDRCLLQMAGGRTSYVHCDSQKPQRDA